jgi:uncharacterized membrane-anchored protein
MDKPHEQGGLEVSRYVASAVLLAFMVVMLAIFRPRAARAGH